VHLIEDSDSSVDVVESDTGIDEAVVKDLIRGCFLVLLDLLKKVESSFKIFLVSGWISSFFNSFNQSTKGKVIWDNSILLHL